MNQPRRPPPPLEGGRRPSRVEPVPGTPYGLAIYTEPPTTSGQAIGALVAGVGSVLTSLLVACFGFAELAAASSGEAAGWGALVGGAFTILAGFLGAAAIGLGVVGQRRVRRGAGTVTGGGMAVAGIATGGAGLVVAICSMGLAVLFALG